MTPATTRRPGGCPRVDPYARHRPRALPEPRPDRRARQVRLAVPRRRPRAVGDVGQRPAGTLEPTTLLTALAGATEHIGLIATASTSYNEPYNLARRFASLDHITGGRAGWNIVTTAGAGGRPQLRPRRHPAAPRPLRARRRVRRRRRPSSGTAGRTTRSSPTRQRGVLRRRPTGSTRSEHRGEYFRVDGAAQRAALARRATRCSCRPARQRGRQGLRRPLRGGRLHRPADPRGRAGLLRRPQGPRATASAATPTIKILPGIVPVIGATEAEARELDAELDRLIVPEYAKRQLAELLQTRARAARPRRASCPTDLPPEDEIEGAKSRYTLVVELARREHLTVRQLIGRLGGGRGHRTFAGTPEQVADTIEHWFDERRRRRLQHHARRAAVRPGGLRRQGRPDPARPRPVPHRVRGATLREHYGLPRPANQHALAAVG